MGNHIFKTAKEIAPSSMILARHRKFQNLYHISNCNIRNILRESLAFGRDGAIGFCQGSEADSANLVTLLAYDPYRRAEVFRALAA